MSSSHVNRFCQFLAETKQMRIPPQIMLCVGTASCKKLKQFLWHTV